MQAEGAKRLTQQEKENARRKKLAAGGVAHEGVLNWVALSAPWLLSLAVTFLVALRVSNQGYD